MINRLQEIQKYEDEMMEIPLLKAEYVKWPHHAHRFQRNRDLINRMDEIINPVRYIIQPHYTQEKGITAENYEAWLKAEDLEYIFWKCLNSAEKPLEIHSMVRPKKKFNYFIMDEGEAA